VGKLRGEDYNFEFHGKVKDGKMHFRLVMTEAAAVRCASVCGFVGGGGWVYGYVCVCLYLCGWVSVGTSA
jgi:hypothetical protein